MGNVIGAVVSWYAASYITHVIIEREGPGFDIKFPVSFFVCRLCGGLLGPFVTYFLPTRTPQFYTKAVISLSFGIGWVVLFMNPYSPFNQ